MPCLDESPKEIDIALQILDIVTPRDSQAIEPQAVREITQTDHLNKKLLQNFLQRMNVMEEPVSSNTNANDENTDDFDD